MLWYHSLRHIYDNYKMEYYYINGCKCSNFNKCHKNYKCY